MNMNHPTTSCCLFPSSKCHLFLLLVSLLLIHISTSNEVASDALGSESVIVITGAAGFLGSELAIALHRTYGPKKIICIDSMDKGFGTLGPSHPMGIRTDQDLALFEFKRQRAFRVLQTLGATALFYRVDFRPSIPEYYESGEVPVLAHIFESNPDITHVVHFADHYHRGYLNEDEQVDKQKLQIIPRIKGQPKAGMMEAIVEQIKSFTKKHPERRQPHFVYASSSEIYNHKAETTLAPLENEKGKKNHDAFQPPFREQDPVTTPSTLAGVSKLLDEIMARTYHEMDGIYSVGLRFFNIYGPWGLPGSPTFEMAERIVAGESPIILEEDTSDLKYPYAMSDLDDIRDFLYIDDAIDAVMSAMQFRPLLSSESSKSEPRPVVINVGSGKGTTLRTIAKHLVDLFPGVPQVENATQKPPTVSFASLSRAEAILGFSPRVDLKDGLEQLLAWHYERTYPYGSRPAENSELFAPSRYIASKGSISCSRYDVACLKGTPVFPCASECAHESQCIPSFWDDVIAYTKALTSGCHAVMYTIALEDDLSLLPSTVVSVSDKSQPFVEENGGSGNCNIAFVSERSVLYQKLLSLKGDDHIVQHGFWRLIPVHLSEQSRKNEALMLLPKLSPGLFFSVATKHAIYCDPDIILNSVPKLLKESGMQPFNEKNIRGTTAMLVGKRKDSHISKIRWNVTSWQDQVQHHAYRMVRIALVDEMSGDGFSQRIDSSLIVHSLNNDDGRLFRCDIYGEVLQWGSSSDDAAFEFISGLHDMWSRVIAKKTGHEPWWIGEEVQTIDENSGNEFVRIDTNGDPSEEQRRVEEVEEHDARRLEEEEVEEEEADEVDEDKSTDDTVADEADIDADHNGFGVPEEGSADEMDKFPQQRQERYDVPNADDFASGDDWIEKRNGEKVLPVLPKPRDPSAIDVWMGILSSTPIRSFTRIVDMEAVGAVRIDNYDELAHGKI